MYIYYFFFHIDLHRDMENIPLIERKCRFSVKRRYCYQSLFIGFIYKVVYWLYLESRTSEKFISCSISPSDSGEVAPR